jgi:hypothetical protein
MITASMRSCGGYASTSAITRLIRLDVVVLDSDKGKLRSMPDLGKFILWNLQVEAELRERNSSMKTGYWMGDGSQRWEPTKLTLE